MNYIEKPDKLGVVGSNPAVATKKERRVFKIKRVKECKFVDEINEEVIHFKSDAEQRLITSLQFEEWHTVKHILLNWGYKIIEKQNNN